MNVNCLKCKNDEYYVKTVIYPEKNPGLKINLGVYYLKICKECGFVEMYAAEILDTESKIKGDAVEKKTCPEY